MKHNKFDYVNHSSASFKNFNMEDKKIEIHITVINSIFRQNLIFIYAI